jgi:hypothetical protein
MCVLLHVCCCLQVGATARFSLHELKVSSKLGDQRRRQQRAAAGAGRGGRNAPSWAAGETRSLFVLVGHVLASSVVSQL